MQAFRSLAIAVLALTLILRGAWMVRAQEPTVDADVQTGVDAQAGADAPITSIPSKNLLAIIKAGGILMLPIFFCSVLTLVFVLERGMALRRSRVIPGPFVKRFLHQLSEGNLDREEALELCRDNKSPIAEVFAGAVRKWGRPAVEVEQAYLDNGERAANGLRRYVRMFNGVSTISPLLGLLGTVFGMINAFNDIAGSDAMGRPELLAAGISEALITTAAGLVVAIPALAFYLFFTARVDQLVMAIDAYGEEIVNHISAEAQQSSPPRRNRSRDAA